MYRIQSHTLRLPSNAIEPAPTASEDVAPSARENERVHDLTAFCTTGTFGLIDIASLPLPIMVAVMIALNPLPNGLTIDTLSSHSILFSDDLRAADQPLLFPLRTVALLPPLSTHIAEL